MLYDVFISYVNEDKDDFVRPLAQNLSYYIKVWYDDFTLKIGDNLNKEIDKGLSRSRFGIVILSPSFFKKKWPQKELNKLLEKERNGQKVILPIWHKIDQDEVEKFSPILADKYSLKSSLGITEIVKRILEQVVKYHDKPAILDASDGLPLNITKKITPAKEMTPKVTPPVWDENFKNKFLKKKTRKSKLFQWGTFQNIGAIASIIGLILSIVFILISNNSPDTVLNQAKPKESSRDVFPYWRKKISLVELNYWIETKENGDYADVWVKVPEIPAYSEKIIYLCYGNRRAKSKSNIQDTFIIGDDWNDGNYTSKPIWSVKSGDFLVRSNVLTQTQSSGNIYMSQTRLYNTCWEWKWRINGPGELAVVIASDGYSLPYSEDHGYFVRMKANEDGTLGRVTFGCVNGVGVKPTPLLTRFLVPDSEWHTVEISRDQTYWELFVDGESCGYCENTTYLSSKYVNMQLQDVTEIDDFRISQYANVDMSNISIENAQPSIITGFYYMKKIKISESANPDSLIDYQIFVKINYSEGMQSDFDDIRFYDVE